MKVRWSVYFVRCGVESPKTEVANVPSLVGVPVGVAKTPQRDRKVCKLSYAEVMDVGGAS